MAGYPWPDKPKIPELVVRFDTPDEMDDMEFEAPPWVRPAWEPPTDKDIDEENALMLRGQQLFRWTAQLIAIAQSEVPEVQRVAAFGAVAQPLGLEVPRFREFRRHRIRIFHECADLDLAVWTTDASRLDSIKKALHRGLALVQHTPYGGVAHHQVDVHILEAATGIYQGRLCIFGQCPKAGKRECFVPGCGAQPFLRQFKNYHFDMARFEAAPNSDVVRSGARVPGAKAAGRWSIVN
jgi:hypothetical protein